MNYAIGTLLAILVCGAAFLLRLDRDRRFYTAMLIVIAMLYVLFAIMGFRVNPWLLVVALAAHGTFDFTHELFFLNRGVPGWYPGFCLAYGVVAAGILGTLLLTKRLRAYPSSRGFPSQSARNRHGQRRSLRIRRRERALAGPGIPR